MDITLYAEEHQIGVISLNMTALRRIMAAAAAAENASASSTPMTPKQARDLISRIDPKSVELLEAIAKNEDGRVSWAEMKRILKIKEWHDFTRRYGKGITRALRYVLDEPDARLIHWSDEEWPEDKDLWDDSEVWIDGQALKSIRIVFNEDAND